MHVIIVDDDLNKIRQLRSLLYEELPSAHIDERHSFQSGLKQVLTENPDLLILDMTMPTFDIDKGEHGGRERRYAGEEILRRLRRRSRTFPVIVVTQFEQFGEGADLVTLEELRGRLATEFPTLYVGAVFYQASDSRWQDDLRNLLKQARSGSLLR